MEPLIQYYFPTDEASSESQRERGSRISPPLFYLHLWWARRPLAASRAVVAALSVDTEGPPPRRFVDEFLRAVRLQGRMPRPAYNYPPDRGWIRRHSRVAEATLLNPFAGGGSISFEALRLGFKKVVAVEYNPVAYIILKATLEYPLKYGGQLARDVRRWAEWLVGEAQRRLEKYYPPHPKGRPTNYIWVRVYRCPDGRLMPSLANPLLSKDSKLVLMLEGFKPNGEPIIKIIKVKDPGEAKKLATVKAKTLQCPGAALPSQELMRQYRQAMDSWEARGLYGHHPAILAAVKLEDGSYVEPTQEMIDAYKEAEEDLRAQWNQLIAQDLIPTEDIPVGDTTKGILNRGINKFYKLFNARQLLTHAIVVKLIREAYNKMVEEGYGEDYAKAVATYLALGHGKLLDYNSTITIWDGYSGYIGHTFTWHAYVFGDDYAEGDPLSSASSIISWVFFSSAGVVRALERIVELLEGSPGGVEVLLGDAVDPSLYTGLDGRVYVATGPPYYDNVQYGELSDFFYVWLKRSIGHLHPEAFLWELTPKEGEIVVNRTRGRSGEWFQSRLRDAFEALRLAGASRLAVMYAHRSSEGLYVVFEALLDAGWKPVGVWSVASEALRSLHISGKAAAKSMLVIGAVPRPGGSGCFWDASLRARVDKAVKDAVSRALELGLHGIDAVMAGIGAAFGVAGDCWPLRRLDGSPVSIKDIVDYAAKAGVAELASSTLRTVEIDPLSTMYMLARTVYGEPDYDELRRLGYAMGVSHDSFIQGFTGKPRQVKGRKVYPVKPLDEVQAGAPPTSLVEALALAVRRFKAGGLEAAVKTLEDSGYKLDEMLCRYVEVLWPDSNGAEREALAAILNLCAERLGGRGRNALGGGGGGGSTST